MCFRSLTFYPHCGCCILTQPAHLTSVLAGDQACPGCITVPYIRCNPYEAIPITHNDSQDAHQHPCAEGTVRLSRMNLDTIQPKHLLFPRRHTFPAESLSLDQLDDDSYHFPHKLRALAASRVDAPNRPRRSKTVEQRFGSMSADVRIQHDNEIMSTARKIVRIWDFNLLYQALPRHSIFLQSPRRFASLQLELFVDSEFGSRGPALTASDVLDTQPDPRGGHWCCPMGHWYVDDRWLDQQMPSSCTSTLASSLLNPIYMQWSDEQYQDKAADPQIRPTQQFSRRPWMHEDTRMMYELLRILDSLREKRSDRLLTNHILQNMCSLDMLLRWRTVFQWAEDMSKQVGPLSVDERHAAAWGYDDRRLGTRPLPSTRPGEHWEGLKTLIAHCLWLRGRPEVEGLGWHRIPMHEMGRD